jgi:hypothetical protein
VPAADVFEFAAHQRGDRGVVRLADRAPVVGAKLAVRPESKQPSPPTARSSPRPRSASGWALEQGHGPEAIPGRQFNEPVTRLRRFT